MRLSRRIIMPSVTINKKNAFQTALLLLSMVVTFSIVMYFFDARLLIETIGVRNSYLLLFFIALLGGVSSFTTGSYLGTLYLLVNEGLSFWLLGLTGGFAIFLGDIVFFYLGKNGYKFLESSEAGWAISFKDWIDKRSLRGLKLFTYFYVGLTPMPNDLITLALGASKYRFRDFLIPLFIGSIQLQTLTAYLFSLGLLSSLNN